MKWLSGGSPVGRKRRHFASGRLQQIEARPVTKPASFAAQSSIETSIGNFEEKLKTRRPLKILVAGEGFEPSTFGL